MDTESLFLIISIPLFFVLLIQLIVLLFYKNKNKQVKDLWIRFNNCAFLIFGILVLWVLIKSMQPSHCNTRACGSIDIVFLIFLNGMFSTISFLNLIVKERKFIYYSLSIIYTLLILASVYYLMTVPRWKPDIVFWRGTEYENYSLPKTNVFILNFLVSIITLLYCFKSIRSKK